jgi:broad-specificity NMP kinase
MKNYNIICITGTPGSGKTYLAKRLSKDLKSIYLNGNEIIKKYNLSEGYDNIKKCKIVDEKKFSKSVIKEYNLYKKIIAQKEKEFNKTIKKTNTTTTTNKNKKTNTNTIIKRIIKINKKMIETDNYYKKFIIDSHLSHNLPKNKVTLCIVCKCNLKILKQRLKKRKYNNQKIKDNLEAEIFETCLTESQTKNHEIIIYNNTEKSKLNEKNKLNTKKNKFNNKNIQSYDILLKRLKKLY